MVLLHIILGLGVLAYSSLFGAEPPAPPDPAAHTVLIPFDSLKPIKDQKPQRYYLDRADFERLWTLAKENRMPEKRTDGDDAKPEAVLHSALYRATIEDERLVIEASYEINTRGRWAKLPVTVTEAGNNNPLPLREVRVDGKPGALIKGEVAFEQPGRHTVQATFDLVRDRSWKKAFLNLPSARAAMLLLKLAEQDALPAFTDPKLVAVEETVNQERLITVGLGSATALEFERVQRRPVSEALPPSADLTVTTSLTGGMRLHGMVKAHFAFPGSARKQVALVIDPDWTLDAAPVVTSGQQPVRDLRVSMAQEAGKQVLNASFPHEVSDQVTLDFHLTPKTLKVAHTPFVAPKAGRWETVTQLLAQDGVQLIARPTASQRRLANEDYTYTAGDNSKQTLPLIRYRLGNDDTLAFDSKPADEKTSARIDYVYQLSEQKQELAAAIALTRERGAWRQVRIGLPAGMDIQSVQGPQLTAWELQGRDLYLRFNDFTGREAKVVVYVANTVLKATKNWTLEPLNFEGIEKVKGSAIVAAHAAVEARLDGFTADHDLREIDPASLTATFTITAPLEKKRAIEFERADWKLNVVLQDLPSRFSADAILLTQATETGVLLSQQIGLIVEQGALKKLLVRLPKDLPEATVTGDQLRDVQSRINGNLREYECTFQSQGGLLGRAALTFDMQLPLTDTELAIPFVEVADVERLRRWFVLDNSSNRETKTLQADGVEACVKDALPYVPDVLTQPQFYQGRVTGGLKVAFTQLQSSSGNAAIVTLADITTVLRPDGERWDTVVYSISNRSLQFLPVILPEKAELIAVNVSGEPVRADEEKRDGKRVRLIPLIQTRAGERSMEIRLVYRIKGGSLSKQVKLDDPDLVGLSAERTVWTASLPKGWTLDDTLRDTFGNMEPIAEEGRDIEKLQSWMSDLSRLNRAMRSSKDADFNSKALQEADKLNQQIEAVTQKVESKSQSRRSIYNEYATKSESKQSEKYAGKLDSDLSKVKEELGKQVIVLNENRVAQPVFNSNNGRSQLAANGWSANNAAQTLMKSGSGTLSLSSRYAEYQGLVGDVKEKAKELNTLTGDVQIKGRIELNNKVQRAKQLEQELGSEKQILSQTTGLNDNVAVNNDFFKTGASTLTLTGANTYTGSTIVDGGNLTMGGMTISGAIGGSARGDGRFKNTPTDIAPLLSNNSSQISINGTSGNNLNAFGNASNARAFNNIVGQGSLAEIADTASINRGDKESLLNADPFAAPSSSRLPALRKAAVIAEGDVAAGKPDSMLGDGAARQPAPPPAASPAPADSFSDSFNNHPAAKAAKKEGADGKDLTTQAVNQLRPTGRHSLQVEVPLSGETWHFRKLKDHAVLDLPLKQEWDEGKTAQATAFGLGLGAWSLLALFTARRRKRA